MDHFLPFSLLTTKTIKSLKKWKKMHRDIIILHKCTKNHNMLYCSWDMVHDGCNFYFSFWTIFCPFTPLTTKTIKILKKWKKTHRDIIILHKCTKNRDNMLYCSWDMACDRCNFYCSFWTIFCPFTPLTTKTIKTLKKWKKKKHMEISSFYIRVQKSW